MGAVKELLRKGQNHWTEEEVILYETPAGVKKEIDYLRDTLKNTGQSLASLNQRLETQDQRLLALGQKKTLETRNIQPVEILNMQEFKNLPNIPFKELPCSYKLAADSFKMTIDRDEVYLQLLRFYVCLEPLFTDENSLRQVSLFHF